MLFSSCVCLHYMCVVCYYLSICSLCMYCICALTMFFDVYAVKAVFLYVLLFMFVIVLRNLVSLPTRL